MKILRKLMPRNERDENEHAVRVFGRLIAAADILAKWRILLPFSERSSLDSSAIGRRGHRRWPTTSGDYVIGNPTGPLAICTLTSRELMEPLCSANSVAIAGRLITVNLGIEKIIRNVISNPNIRYLMLCGRDSPIFHPAQALHCLFHNGIDSEKRIREAKGHFPVLKNVSVKQIEQFRNQCELIDCTGETRLENLNARITDLAVNANSESYEFQSPAAYSIDREPESDFRTIRPGGSRESLAYDPNGFFVIEVDREAENILLRHYLPDNTPAHEMRGRKAEPMLLGLLRKKLVTQMSHAGYLGIELAKAETALRLGFPYEQDHPLKKKVGKKRRL